jgi:hypothetical protein
MDDEERIKKLIKTIFKPVSASSEFKERLLKSLTNQISSRTVRSPVPMWQRRRLWIAVTAVVVLAVVGTAIWLSRPETPSTVTSPEVPEEESPVAPEETVPSDESPVIPEEPVQMANFRLLISDEVNAIGDFVSLKVAISSIGLLPAGGTDGWITENVTPTYEAELTELTGDNATELWNGYVDPGDYTKVFIYVDNVTGTLLDYSSANVTLPSNKLQISSPFTVSDGSLVSFVFDLTVVPAGGSGRYILKPQIAQSGPDKPFKLITPEGQPDELGKPKGELGLSIKGNVAKGNTITLKVTDNGSGLEGAKVIVTFGGEKILVAKTDRNGGLEIKLPDNVGVLKIEASFREKRGELEIEITT